MNKKQFLQSLQDTYCRIGKTKHGVGVVAVRPIPKGVNPFKNCDPFGDGLKIPAKDLNKAPIPESVRAMVRDYCVFTDGVYHVPNYGIDAIDKSYYTNHSRKPNLVSKDGGESFVTKRKIKTGEELLADYKTYNDRLDF